MTKTTITRTGITLIHAIQTCHAIPTQWDAWDTNYKYWYLRFRGGLGSIGRDYDIENAVNIFEKPGENYMELEGLLTSLRVNWRPDLYSPRMFLSPTPEKDPNAFQEAKDDIIYHLCDYPMHSHHIPYRFDNCNKAGCWTWEQRYRWLSEQGDSYGTCCCRAIRR